MTVFGSFSTSPFGNTVQYDSEPRQCTMSTVQFQHSPVVLFACRLSSNMFFTHGTICMRVLSVSRDPKVHGNSSPLCCMSQRVPH